MNYPPEFIRQMLEYLDEEEMIKVCMLNKDIYNNVCNSTFWRNLSISRFNLTPESINKYKGSNTYMALYKKISEFVNRQTDPELIQAINDTIKDGSNTILMLLLDNISDINIIEDDSINVAVREGYTSTLDILIDRGVEMNFDDLFLHATAGGHVSMMHKLYKLGATVGHNAMLIAAQYKNYIAMSYLHYYLNIPVPPNTSGIVIGLIKVAGKAFLIGAGVALVKHMIGFKMKVTIDGTEHIIF